MLVARTCRRPRYVGATRAGCEASARRSRACRGLSGSGEHSHHVLDVAHIRSYAESGPHDVRNGLLLRTDIHRLFDRGYVTVTPDFCEVSRRLREEFENGKTYYELRDRLAHGVIGLPDRAADLPDPALLRWHNEQVFERGAA